MISRSHEVVPGSPDVPGVDLAELPFEGLEKIISADIASFVRVGAALMEIRRRKLYREEFRTFDNYCRVRWGFGRKQGYRTMVTARIALELFPVCDTEAITSEGQIRALSRLKGTKLRSEAFDLAKQSAPAGRPTSKHVQKAVSTVLLRLKVESMKRNRKGRKTAPDAISPEGRIIHGDAGTVTIFPEKMANLILGSPPYNIGMKYPTYDDGLPYDRYLRKVRKWLKNCFIWSAECGRLCLVLPMDTAKYGSQSVAADVLQIAKSVGWNYRTTIIWNEGSHQGWFNNVDPVSSPPSICRCEVILVFSKGEFRRENPGQMPDISDSDLRQWSHGIWQIPGAHANGHPCPFPNEIPKRLIKLFSYTGDVVLDPWAGSGTTLIEASKLGRKWYGIEIEEEYCQLSAKRVSESLGHSCAL